MPESIGIFEGVQTTRGNMTIAARSQTIRRQNFPARMTFHTPGFRGYQTADHDNGGSAEFVSISVTGNACALHCEHCNTSALRGMMDLTRFDGSLYDLCARLAQQGTRGVLISGGSDAQGRVPLKDLIPQMARVRQELNLAMRVHVGLPDAETCAGLATLNLDGAMIDVVGHQATIRDVLKLDADPEDYEDALAELEKNHVAAVPHIVLGLHFGKMLGEWRALEMIARHPAKMVVLVMLVPTAKTGMARVIPPSLPEIGDFFHLARQAFPTTELMLGCARPLGKMKVAIDRLAVDAGLNGIAFPAADAVTYARQVGYEPEFINACCGVTW